MQLFSDNKMEETLSIESEMQNTQSWIEQEEKSYEKMETQKSNVNFNIFYVYGNTSGQPNEDGNGQILKTIFFLLVQVNTIYYIVLNCS